MREQKVTRTRMADTMRSLLLLLLATSAATLLLCSYAVAASAPGAPKTIVDLQPFRETSSVNIKGAGGSAGIATLINLNPNINAWYLLQLTWGNNVTETYHLENAGPRTQRPLLDNGNAYGLVIMQGKDRSTCDLWGSNGRDALKEARKSSLPYAPLCGGKVYLRNPTKGHRSGIEAVTDFLRDEVPAGEKIITSVRDTIFTYLYEQKAEQKVESQSMDGLPRRKTDEGPAPALLDPKEADRMAKPIDLGIATQESTQSGMIPGAWYAARDNPGIYVSVIQPKSIAAVIMQSYKTVVGALDSVESGGLAYLVAFDLGQFDVHYSLGTEHPKVGWSSHIPDQMKDKSLPGPDGIGTIAPLVSTGLVDPIDAGRIAATFTGGFKRQHGAFKYGELSLKSHGTHYGFLEDGVIFSKLQPALATLYVLKDGWVDMKTWTEEDNYLLPTIAYARQNGVPLITGFDKATRMSVPGPLVGRWGAGNWSGSAEEKLRTMRAGAALQEFKGKRFLIYAFFWSATPSAMARVFQAYQVSYAMLLDMNALVHTYLAVYSRQGANLYVQHLIKGMSGEDMSVKGARIPRFVAYADDRDFFYLTRKEVP